MGSDPGVQCPFGGHPQGLVMKRGVRGQLHHARPARRTIKLTVLRPYCVRGTGVRAVSRAGKVAVPPELLFILGMETDDRKAT